MSASTDISPGSDNTIAERQTANLLDRTARLPDELIVDILKLTIVPRFEYAIIHEKHSLDEIARQRVGTSAKLRMIYKQIMLRELIIAFHERSRIPLHEYHQAMDGMAHEVRAILLDARRRPKIKNYAKHCAKLLQPAFCNLKTLYVKYYNIDNPRILVYEHVVGPSYNRASSELCKKARSYQRESAHPRRFTWPEYYEAIKSCPPVVSSLRDSFCAMSGCFHCECLFDIAMKERVKKSCDARYGVVCSLSRRPEI